MSYLNFQSDPVKCQNGGVNWEAKRDAVQEEKGGDLAASVTA